MNILNRYISIVAANKKYQFWLFFAILFLLSLFMIFCYDPIYRGHDFYFHFRRLSALADSFRDGTFPAYIDYKSAHNYGYLSNTFYSDIILVPFAALSLITSTLFAYNFMLFTMTLLCGVLMYKAINKIYHNSFAAFISALIFTFCSYRLFDIYNRGALGEALAFTFFPLILLGLYYIIQGDYKRKWYVLVIGYTLMIYTHVLSSVIVFATTILFFIIYNKPLRKEPKRLYYLILSGVATLFLIAYYLLPMLEQMMSNSFYYQSESWADPTLYSTSPYWLLLGLTEGLTKPEQFFFPKIGLLLTLGVCLRIFVYGKPKKLRGVDIFVIVGLIFLFLTSTLCPWDKFPFTGLRIIQFPWRLFAFVSFFFAIAEGYYLSQIIKSKKQMTIAAIGITLFISLIIIGDSQNYKKICYPERIALDTPSLVNNYLGGGKEYLPSKASAEKLEIRGEKVTANNADTEINNLTREGRFTYLDVTISKADNIELPLIYYKGYKVTLNDKEIPINESENGLIQINVNQSGRVEAYYAGTILQHVSFWITILSIVALCIYWHISRKKISTDEPIK